MMGSRWLCVRRLLVKRLLVKVLLQLRELLLIVLLASQALGLEGGAVHPLQVC